MVRRLPLLAALAACASPAPPPAQPPPSPAPRAIPFEVVESSLTTGDEIQVTSLHGDRPGCVAGGTYAIAGTYVLGSRGEAELSVTARGGETSPAERAVIRGAGEFSLTFELRREGLLEVSFQKAGGGASAGGVVLRCGAPP